MKLWVDEVKPAPDGYFWCKSVHSAIREIERNEIFFYIAPFPFKDSQIELIDIVHNTGHDSDFIKLLDWLKTTDRKYPIYIH